MPSREEVFLRENSMFTDDSCGLEHHYSYGRDKMLAVARMTATPEQRAALASASGT